MQRHGDNSIWCSPTSTMVLCPRHSSSSGRSSSKRTWTTRATICAILKCQVETATVKRTCVFACAPSSRARSLISRVITSAPRTLPQKGRRCDCPLQMPGPGHLCALRARVLQVRAALDLLPHLLFVATPPPTRRHTTFPCSPHQLQRVCFLSRCAGGGVATDLEVEEIPALPPPPVPLLGMFPLVATPPPTRRHTNFLWSPVAARLLPIPLCRWRRRNSNTSTACPSSASSPSCFTLRYVLTRCTCLRFLSFY